MITSTASAAQAGQGAAGPGSRSSRPNSGPTSRSSRRTLVTPTRSPRRVWPSRRPHQRPAAALARAIASAARGLSFSGLVAEDAEVVGDESWHERHQEARPLVPALVEEIDGGAVDDVAR